MYRRKPRGERSFYRCPMHRPAISFVPPSRSGSDHACETGRRGLLSRYLDHGRRRLCGFDAAPRSMVRGRPPNPGRTAQYRRRPGATPVFSFLRRLDPCPFIQNRLGTALRKGGGHRPRPRPRSVRCRRPRTGRKNDCRGPAPPSLSSPRRRGGGRAAGASWASCP